MVLNDSLAKVLQWSRDRGANVALTTAICAVPLFGMVGLALDYAMELSTKAKLDAAADAAAIAAITAAENVINGNGGLTGDAIDQGQAQGVLAFKANAGAVHFGTVPAPVVNVIRTGQNGQTLNATATYSTTVQNHFGQLFNIATSQIGGKVASSLTSGQYLDFYLLLDVSGSMGIPSTSAGQSQLALINHDMASQYPTGCTFACHFPGYTGFGLARSNNIQLRADAVGNAVCQLLQQAQNDETLTNQFRVGIYPFIDNIETFFPLSTNLSAAMTTVNNGFSSGCHTATPALAIGNLLDTGDSTSPMGSGGTHFENALPQVNAMVTSVGNGTSSSSTKPFIFLITDGVDNNQFRQTAQNSWTGSQPQLMDPTLCTALKNRGITISILYIPHQPIANPNPSFANDEDDKVNALIAGPPGIAATLQNCASPLNFHTANTPADINADLQNMLAQALQQARLIN